MTTQAVPDLPPRDTWRARSPSYPEADGAGARSDDDILMAEEAGAIVGLVGSPCGLRHKADVFVQFAAPVVDPGHQGRSVGAALVGELATSGGLA